MTISPLPILIDADDPEDAAGAVVQSPFHPEQRLMRLTEVRVLSPEGIKSRVRSGKVFAANDPERPLFDAVRAMPVALARWDLPAFQLALKKARPWLDRRVEIKDLSATGRGKARFAYSNLINKAVREVRHVLWFPYELDRWAAPLPLGSSTEGEQWAEDQWAENDRWVAPALYCPNEKIAAFLMLFMDYLRVCQHPKCMKVYAPRAINQKCCCPSHANSLRVQRCTARKNAKKSTLPRPR